MWKKILIFVGGGVVGLVVGAVVTVGVYPYIFLSDVVATEQLGAVDPDSRVAKGTFIHADPSDPVHYGKGGVSVYPKLLRLESDFEVGPGPKFHVYLVPSPKIEKSGDVKGMMYVDLGRLKAFKGCRISSGRHRRESENSGCP